MPHDLPLFTDLLILLLASIPIAFICHRLRLPVIVGFMITGVMIGPSALGFIKDAHAIESMAEIGVALLLFTIGLEFSLQRLMEMKRLVLGGGGLQVVFTILIVVAVEKLAGRPTNQAVFFGFLFALSSTAIVLKSYMDRMEIDTIYGRASVGILLFQDLCIVPMMLLVPMLSGQQGASAANIALTLGKAAAVIAGIVFTARTVVPFLLFHIVRLRSPEVFIIFVVLVSLGAAWLTSHFGLSMALGRSSPGWCCRNRSTAIRSCRTSCHSATFSTASFSCPSDAALAWFAGAESVGRDGLAGGGHHWQSGDSRRGNSFASIPASRCGYRRAGIGAGG